MLSLTNLEPYISKRQERAVKSDAIISLLHGCAGSHKTTTMIKKGLYNLILHKSNLLFLTLVSSVTDEIRQRLEFILNITFEKSGNHFTHTSTIQGCHIEIANFDAWIHDQFSSMGGNANELGSLFETKRQTLQSLINETHCSTVHMHSTNNADMVLIDEVQDIDPLKMELLLSIYRNGLINIKPISLFFAGDKLQTIHAKALEHAVHPIDMIRAIPEHIEFKMRTCYRCPKAHIEFANLITKPFRDKYGIQAMKAANDNQIDKPFLFTYSDSFGNHNMKAESLARTVNKMIQELLQADAEIKPSDIAIIMHTTNGNPVFYQLAHKLQKTAHHFSTAGDGYNVSIDWLKSEGKSVLLSVHGDKGKGHKAVFFLGFGHYTYPYSHQKFLKEELLSESLLNVAITRSTKYLFIGISSESSSYLHHVYSNPRFADMVYTKWSSLDLPPVYKRCADIIPFSEEPNFEKALKQTGPMEKTQAIIKVKEHIAKNFETLPLPWETILDLDKKPIKFGHTLKRLRRSFEKLDSQDNAQVILGNMTEFLLERRLKPKRLLTWYRQKIQPYPIVYTKREQLLCAVWDKCWNHLLTTGLTTDINMAYSSLRGTFPELPERPSIILHDCYTELNVWHQLNIKKGDEDDDPVGAWNTTLFIHEFQNSTRNPGLRYYMNFFRDKKAYERLKQNIEAFLNYFQIESQSRQQSVEFQRNYSYAFSKVANNKTYQIHGTADMVTSDYIFEIMASKHEDVLEWEVQTMAYVALDLLEQLPTQPLEDHGTQEYPKKKTKQMVIVNMLLGKCFIKTLKRKNLRRLMESVIDRHLTERVGNLGSTIQA